MSKTLRYTDLAVLILIGSLIVYSAYEHFSLGFALSNGNYWGLAGWVISVLVFLIKRDKAYLFIIGLLMLYLFNIVNFAASTITLSSAGNDNPIINPLALVIILAYLLIERKRLGGLWKHSPAERKRQQEAESEFYYKKFRECSPDELNNAMLHSKEYPIAAQIALDKIRSEK